jgi:hypothetical protein
MTRRSKYKSLAERLLANAKPAPDPLPDGTYCLLMQGSIRSGVKGGYVPMSVHERGQPRRTVYAHRLSFTLFVGPIPDGHDVDHRCKVRCCINPGHLQAKEATAHRAETGWPQHNPGRRIPRAEHRNLELI